MRGQNIPVICTFSIFPCVLFWDVKLPFFYKAHYIHTRTRTLFTGSHYIRHLKMDHEVIPILRSLTDITHPAQERLATPTGSTFPDLPCFEQLCGLRPKRASVCCQIADLRFLSEKTRKSNIMAFSIQLRPIF